MDHKQPYPDKIESGLLGSGTISLNKTDLQRLADDRVLDAASTSRKPSSPLGGGRARYLSGYAVECALKACIAKRTSLHDFPDKTVVQKSHTHNLAELLDLAGLRLQLQLAVTPAANPALGINWQSVKDWSERARYYPGNKEGHIPTRSASEGPMKSSESRRGSPLDD